MHLAVQVLNQMVLIIRWRDFGGHEMGQPLASQDQTLIYARIKSRSYSLGLLKR